jgi:NitT/TauT family transport system ATP-binding protein
LALNATDRLELSGVTLALGDQPVLQDLTLAVGRGEVLVVLGPSGCGKTSLLRLMAGLVKPASGTVALNDAPPVPGRGIALMFQSYRLLPWKTVAANVAFALPDLPRALRDDRLSEVLHLVGLERFADRYPAALSGGMRQRVALARALAPRPDFLLMDEPFAALDAQARELMQAELLRLVGASGGPGVVFVTHSVDEALVLGDRIILLSPRPGRIIADMAVPFARLPDPHDHPDYPVLRRTLWERLRLAVLTDPASDFYRPR